MEEHETQICIAGTAEPLEDHIAKLLAWGPDRKRNETEPSSVDADDTMSKFFTTAGALDPPFPPATFIELLRVSNILRQNITAYATNIDGFGNYFKPVVDLDSDDARRLVEEEVEAEFPEGMESPSGDAWKELIDERLERHKYNAAREKGRLDSFFRYAGLDMSFVKLRKLSRLDLEVLGWAGWEVLRKNDGSLSKFVRVPAFTFRLLALDKEPVLIDESQRQVVPWNLEDQSVWKRFRRYVHYQRGQEYGTAIYFKDFMDPRVVSRKTGAYFADEIEMRAKEGADAKAANELIYFSLPSLDSAYGEPRWIGNLLSVLGSRSAEEVNWLYFRSKGVPPMALLISGAAIKPSDAEAIEKRIEQKLHGGPEKFWRVIVITATSDPSNPVQPKIEFKPLTDAMLTDALFKGYDEANRNKVSEAFLIPPLLRGQTKDFNRATADAALRFAETQVFQGERDEFDWIVNTTIMSELDARYHDFRSNSPPLRDPETVVDMVERLVTASVMTPGEARAELANVGFKLDKIDEPWTKRPIQVTAMGIGFTPETGEVAAAPQLAPESAPPPPAPAGDEGPKDEAMRALETQMYQGVKEQRVGAQGMKEVSRRGLALPADKSPSK